MVWLLAGLAATVVAMENVINVVDVEATCWQGQPPPGQVSEIIEIGLTAVDLGSGSRIAKERVLVRPARSRVGEFCTTLTGLTQGEVDTGVSFGSACQLLASSHHAGTRPWASWGDYDRKQFERQCAATRARYPFGRVHAADRGAAAGRAAPQRRRRRLEHRGPDPATAGGRPLARIIRRLGPWVRSRAPELRPDPLDRVDALVPVVVPESPQRPEHVGARDEAGVQQQRIPVLSGAGADGDVLHREITPVQQLVSVVLRLELLQRHWRLREAEPDQVSRLQPGRIWNQFEVLTVTDQFIRLQPGRKRIPEQVTRHQVREGHAVQPVPECVPAAPDNHWPLEQGIPEGRIKVPLEDLVQ
jgi:hypothetical protein